MTQPHLTMDELLALREPGREPGVAAARAHVEACAACRAELDRLDQRVARLRALPALRPARDGWPAVQARLAAERRVRVVRWAGVAGLAAAAAAVLVVSVRRDPALAERQLVAASSLAAEPATLDSMKARSQALEAVVGRFEPGQGVVDGRTARLAAELEDRIATVDAQLQTVDLLPDAAERVNRSLPLWRERVGLLGALVDVHVTRASNVGL